MVLEMLSIFVVSGIWVIVGFHIPGITNKKVYVMSKHGLTALVDEDFASLFGSTTVYHIQTTISDHCALLVDIKKEEAKYGHSNQMKPFRYENMWRQHEDYPDVVTKAWNLSGDAMDLSFLQGKLRNMQIELSRWSYTSFGSVKKNI
jgi:hypothetical protein